MPKEYFHRHLHIREVRFNGVRQYRVYNGSTLICTTTNKIVALKIKAAGEYHAHIPGINPLQEEADRIGKALAKKLAAEAELRAQYTETKLQHKQYNSVQRQRVQSRASLNKPNGTQEYTWSSSGHTNQLTKK